MSIESRNGPASRVDALSAYERARVPDGVRLWLDANEGATPQLELVIAALRQYGSALISGAIVVVEERKSRVRVLPL